MAQFGKWRASLNPFRVDVVGDFAGRGLLPSMERQCSPTSWGMPVLISIVGLPPRRPADNLHLLTDSLDGFQLLHVIHAIETFLAKLRDRGCIFSIL
jgi:hypothetical protein